MEKDVISGEEQSVHPAEVTMHPLTGLHFIRSFMRTAKKFIKEIQPGAYYMAAIDMEYFRLFNKFYGRDVGDKLLIQIADCIRSVQEQYGGIAGHFNADDFCIIMPARMELVEQLRDEIVKRVDQWNDMSGFLPMIGVYQMNDLTVSPEIMYDRATMALSKVSGIQIGRAHV